ncbi:MULTISPECIES: hypothetical protein [Bacillus cereus group]|uniref:hypothetical protein n=1 Tax=Bacillus cereus group TaxID=86661 RepID=UPI000AB307F7|nr:MULTISPECIES: hypothetical protein [Bacillus cereus group]MCX3302047.1 hypothetical protein [Bacillus pacificus]MCX3329649.1 hypothetical protein [Bacillus pacificus]MDA1883101.1 hypothetical protein [Bacillus cereus group sp. BY105LC]
MGEGYSRDETGLTIVRWIPEYWQDYTGDSGIDYEPIEFLYIPCRYKCWGKGI